MGFWLKGFTVLQNPDFYKNFAAMFYWCDQSQCYWQKYDPVYAADVETKLTNSSRRIYIHFIGFVS